MIDNAVFTSDIGGNFITRSNITDPWQVLRELTENFSEEVDLWRQNSSREIERIFAPDSCGDGYALIAIGDYDELKARFSEWGVMEK